MKIAYVGFINPYINDGISKKIQQQLSAWRHLGHDARLYALHTKSSNQKFIEDAILCSFISRGQSSKFIRVINKNLAFFKLKNYLESFRPDIIYCRFDIFQPFQIITLSRFRRLVIEFNTNDLTEFQIGNCWRSWYNRLTRHLLINHADGLVCVTKEIGETLKDFQKPTVVIANGFDVFNTPNLHKVKTTNPNLVFVGTNSYPWHGLDKIILMAGRMPDCLFHIVGTTSDKLPKDLPSNVFLHGFRNQEYLAQLYNRCDVAIGTLALHRKGMSEASPLKVREYLAYGLPVIIGYRDTDIPEQVDFVLNIGNSEDNVIKNLQLIREFVQKMRGYRIEKNVVAKLIDYIHKEECRIRFFQALINREDGGTLDNGD